MDRRTQTAIQRLAKTLPGAAALPSKVEPDKILATAGLGQDYKVSSGAGLASPVTEISRTLHTTQAVSSDGLFVWSVPDTITMVDGNGRSIDFVYAEP